MTPQEALCAQIAKNERILEVIVSDSVEGITQEGREYKMRELKELNAGLCAALELVKDHCGRSL